MISLLQAPTVRTVSREEETEQDEIEDQAYHFAEHEATAYQADDMDAEAEDIDADEEEPEVSHHVSDCGFA